MQFLIVQFLTELKENMIFQKHFGCMFGKFHKISYLIIEGSDIYFVYCPLLHLYMVTNFLRKEEISNTSFLIHILIYLSLYFCQREQIN